MCDTLVIVEPGRVLFAKNSDRDANEAHAIEWHGRASYPPGAVVRCTWIEIPQVANTYAVLISRPFWMWGAEIGANECGVAIGNEAVFTRQPCAKQGLTGMDLLRLALERAATAEEACHVITTLLERHGQGGGCGFEDRAFTYHNSFIVADPTRAFVLETAGRFWAVEEVRCGARTISNTLTIPGFVERHANALYTWFGAARKRQQRTLALAERCTGVGDLFTALRDHGETGAAPRYSPLNGGMACVCMHAGGFVKSAQTTSSWVAELRQGDALHWVTGTAAPCTGLFKPVRVEQPVDSVGSPGAKPDASLWWRHEHLHRAVMRDPQTLVPLFAPERDAVEAAWLANPPDSAEAFAIADRLLERWFEAIRAKRTRDTRPPWARRYWRLRQPAW